MLEVKKLNFNIGKFSLKDINITIDKGEYFVLLGPPGSGKSILGECIAGLKKPGSGSILLNSKDVTEREPRDRRIGYVPQDYALIPFLTVRENVCFGKKAKELSAEETDELLELTQIRHLADRNPETLSGGEKQKTALARALAIKPDILILDEPVSALDENTRESLCLELKRIQQKLKYTVYHISHIFEETLILADKIGIISDGEIVQSGKPEEIFQSPKSLFVAEFTRTRNIIPVSFLKQKTDYNSFKADDNASGVIRPEDVIILKPGETPPRGTPIAGIVTEVLKRYPLVWINLDCGIDIWTVVLHRDLEAYGIESGKEINVILPEDQIKIISQ